MLWENSTFVFNDYGISVEIDQETYDSYYGFILEYYGHNNFNVPIRLYIIKHPLRPNFGSVTTGTFPLTYSLMVQNQFLVYGRTWYIQYNNNILELKSFANTKSGYLLQIHLDNDSNPEILFQSGSWSIIPMRLYDLKK